MPTNRTAKDVKPGAIELVPCGPDGAEAFLRWRDDETTRRFNPVTPLTLEGCRQRLVRESNPLSKFDTAEVFRWFVQHDGVLAGTVALSELNRPMRVAEVAYTIAPEQRGQGVGSAAVRLMIEGAFTQTPLRKLVAHVHEDNVASHRLLTRLGFVREGVLREHFLIEGRPANQVLFGLLAREWRR